MRNERSKKQLINLKVNSIKKVKNFDVVNEKLEV